MSCKTPNRLNGEESKLYNSLLSIVKNENDAEELHNSMYTDDFFEIFGDFVNNPDEMMDRTDENGEPRMYFNNRLNKYFILDVNGQQYFFPPKQNGLKAFFRSNEIKEFAQSLAHNFYEEHIVIDKKTGDVIVTEDQTLKDFVNEYIRNKISKLEESEDYDEVSLSMSLDDSLDHIDEWVESVRNFFKSVKLDNRLEEKEDFIANEESANDEIMRKESFLKSSKDSISNNTKLYLSLIPDMVKNENGEVVKKKNEFGDDTFVGFDEIYTVLNNALRDITPTYDENGEMEDEFDLYLDEIKKLIPFKSYLQKVYNDLTSSNYTENEKNQFTQAFRLVKNNFLGSELTVTFDSKGNKIVGYTVKNLSDVSSRKSNLIQQWKFNFEVLGISKKDVEKYAHLFRRDYDKYAARSADPSDKDVKNAIDDLRKSLKKIGAYGTEEGLERFLYEGQLERPSNDILMQKVISSFDSMTREMENAKEKDNEGLFENQTMFKNLAEAEAFFIKEGSDATIFSVGKTKWVYSRASFLSQQINKWKRNPALLIQQYESNDHTKSSLWMEYLTAAEYSDYNKRVEESRKRLADVVLNIFNSVQTRGESTDAVDNKSITDTDALNDYIHKIMGGRYGNGKTYHKTALAADKSTEFQLYFGNDPNFFNLFANAFVENEVIKVSPKILDIFFNYFNGEYKRMAFEHQFVAIEANKNKLRQNYHLGNKNAFKSQLFPSLSINFKKDGTVVQPSTELDLYDEQGVPLYEDLNEIKSKITPLIQDALSKIIDKTHDTFIQKQLIKFNTDGEMYNNAIDSDLFANMQQDGSVETASIKLAADVTINSLVSQIEYSKMFTGDTAYYKNLDDYLKRVPETYTDGQYGRFPQAEAIFNIASISGVVISPDSLDAMREYLSPEIVDKYEGKTNSTDGQAWITPERWKSLMLALGKPEYLVNKIYDKMYNDNAKFSEKEKKLLSTILKGVHYELTPGGVPIFLKYSQAVLIPSMIKNTGLETLLNKMKSTETPNGRGIDELITIDGIKVGSLKPNLTHDENGNVIDAKDITLNPMELRNEFWKLQQDLPVKGSKQTDVGSQVQQIAFAALAHDKLDSEGNIVEKKFELEDGTVLSRESMKHYLNDIFGAMTVKGMKSVIKDLGLNSGSTENPYQFTDESKIFDMIIDQMSSRKDVTSNYMEALESHTSPYGVPGAKEMFHNVFNAYVTDRIVKIKTNGGGFIQMSDYGLSYNDVTKGKSGIKLTPWFENSTDTKLHTPKVIGTSPKTGKKIIQPGGCFISGTLISKYLPNWSSFSSEELFGTLNEKTGKYENGMIDQEILQNIIAYRIPTQGLGSADALTVMGILPDSASDTIIPYTGITTKTGSDFDIDKMYLMFPSFKPSYNTDMTAVYKFLREEVHQGNVQASILYIQDLLKSLELDSEDLASKGFDLQEFFRKADNANYISKTISQSDRALTMALVNDANKEHPLVKKMFDKYNIKATHLNYVDPNHNNRSEDMMEDMPLEVLQNKLISAYKSILTNEDVIENVMNPIDSPDISDDVKNLNGQEEQTDLSAFDGVAQVKTKSEFMKGKAGLGQNVNSLVDSIRGSMASLYMIGKESALGKGHMNENGETVFDKENSVALTEKEMKFYVEDYNSKKADNEEPMTLERIKSLERMNLNDSMTALINAFVDIVKDQYIVKGNWTTITNNIGFLMLRAGIHPYVVTSFMSQQVLKDYVSFITNMESNVIDKSNKILQEFKLKFAYDSIAADETVSVDIEGETRTLNKKEVFRRLFTIDNIRNFDDPSKFDYKEAKSFFTHTSLPVKLAEGFGIEKERVVTGKKSGKQKVRKYVPKEYFDELRKVSFELVEVFEDVFEAKEDIEFKDMSLIDLRTQITSPTPEFQTAVLKVFINFQELAKQLTKNVKASKISVDGPGKNISSLIISTNIINELLDNKEEGQLGGFETKLKNNVYDIDGNVVQEKDTMLKHVMDNGLDFVYNIMRANPKFFLTADDNVVKTFNKVSELMYGNTLQSEKLAEKLDKGFYSYIMSGFKPLQMDNDIKRDLLLNMPKRLEYMQRKYPKNALLKKMYPREGEFMKLGRTDEELKNKDFYQKHYVSMPNLKTSVSSQNELVDGWADLFEVEPAFAEDMVKYSYLITGFNNNINAFFQKIPAVWFNKNRFNSYLINTRNREGGIYEDFIDQFFRNNYYDESLCRRTFLNFKEPKYEGQYNNSIKGISSYVAFRHQTNKGYMLYTSDKEDRRSYYKLIGADPDGNFIYARTSVLGNRDNKANRIIEYSIGDTFAESVLTSNRVTMNEDTYEAWTNIYMNDSLDRVVIASETPGGIKVRTNDKINTMLANNLQVAGGEVETENPNTDDYDVNHFYTEYGGFDQLLIESRVKASASGELSIDGKNYKVLTNKVTNQTQVEIQEEGDTENLIFYPTADKSFGMLIGTRSKGTEDFDTGDNFKGKKKAAPAIQEAQPSLLDSEAKKELINKISAKFQEDSENEIFKEAGIAEIADIENMPDEQLSDLIEKICK